MSTKKEAARTSPRIYAVALPKGGSTKTTTAAELVCQLAQAGQRVLALDLDQQGTLTSRLGVTRDTEVEAVAVDVLTGDATAEQAAIASPSVPGADVIAGTHQLADVDNMPEVSATLREYLPTLTRWDAVVIDTPPALGIATLAALAAADVVIAPVACEVESYEQVGRLEKFIEQRVARRLRPGQQIHALVPTRYDRRRVLDRDVVTQLSLHYGDRVTNPVRQASVVRDSYVANMPVGIYAPNAPVVDDYRNALTPLHKKA